MYHTLWILITKSVFMGFKDFAVVIISINIINKLIIGRGYVYGEVGSRFF
jgi:hypothetical protein